MMFSSLLAFSVVALSVKISESLKAAGLALSIMTNFYLAEKGFTQNKEVKLLIASKLCGWCNFQNSFLVK